MKAKLAPRHIIPVVCYASYIVGALVLAVYAYIAKQSYTVPESVGGTLPGAEILATGLNALACYVTIILSLLVALFASMPLTFSAINIKKKNRKLAVACLIFDILAVQIGLSFLPTTVFMPENHSFIPGLLAVLAVSASALVMNILNIKNNVPTPKITAEAEHS